MKIEGVRTAVKVCKMNKLFMSGNALLADVWLCSRTINANFFARAVSQYLGLHSCDQRSNADRVRMGYTKCISKAKYWLTLKHCLAGGALNAPKLNSNSNVQYSKTVS